MKKLHFHAPQILAQSTTAAILFDGFQDPHIRANDKGEIFVTYHGRRDCDETFGKEDSDPMLKSCDGGDTWERCTDVSQWIAAGTHLPNGDIFSFREVPSVPRPSDMPEPGPDRQNFHVIANTCAATTLDEAAPWLGEAGKKVFCCRRVLADTGEIVEEEAPVRWKQMPLRVYDTYLRRPGGGRVAVAPDGTLWTTSSGPHFLEDGTLTVNYLCTHVLRSTDNGHSWDYVNTIDYRMEYNDPHCIDLEGFSETAIMATTDGGLFCVIRSGSLHPFKKGDDAHPAPQLYCARSDDQGQTWDVKPFYDFGVLPVCVQLRCGTTLLVSGRPGVYVRQCDDPRLEQWGDPVFLVKVPPEAVYDAYYEYTCSNTGIVALDDRTAMIVYSNFQLTAPDGKRAKSILVQKVTVED